MPKPGPLLEHASRLLALCCLAPLSALALGTAVAPDLDPDPDLGPEIIKSPQDQRSYRYLQLDNGMRVLLISDPTSDHGAAALDVNIGHSANPPGRDGLAHYLEHLLFLGTEKYPEPGEYRKFMVSHGGGDNAFTSFEHTNYFFQIDQAYLEPALDRFAQFFIAPRFDPKYVGHEREVVHSEYSYKIQNDARRINYAQGQVLNPAHPSSRFAVGSLETLADRDGNSIREELIEFYERTYSAHLMTLVVLGTEPLETLADLVRKKFAPIRRTDATRATIDVPRFEAGRLPARINIVPIKDLRSLSFIFPIPPVFDHYRTRPTYLLSNQIGHEGEGSLLSALKARGWAEGLSAGVGYQHRDAGTFNVSIQLTPEGLDRIEAIGTALFAYLDLIGKDGITAWRYEEVQRLNEVGFRFKEDVEAGSYARSLAYDLHQFPAQDALRGHYLTERFAPQLTRSYLAYLRPDNLLVSVVAQGLPVDASTDWYGAAYGVTPLDPALIETWRGAAADPALSLAPPNDFIAENLDLVAGEGASDRPVKLAHEAGFELWHQRDTTFAVPRTDLYASLRSPVANDTARHAALTRLYVAMVNDQLNEFAYPALLAGMRYQLYPHLRGVTVNLSGYSDKEEVLLNRILDALANPQLPRARFDIIKHELQRRWQNQQQDGPSDRGIQEAKYLLLDPHWTARQRLAELDSITIEELEAFITHALWERLEVIVLAHGNLGAPRAVELGRMVEQRLLGGAIPTSVPISRVLQLDSGATRRVIDNTQPDAAIAVYYQSAQTGIERRAAIGVLGEILRPRFFEEIRTERKLGYIVYAGPLPVVEIPGFVFVVQSPSASAAELREHVEDFIDRAGAMIEKLSSEDLERNKTSLRTRLLEADTRLAERTRRYWEELDRGYLAFDRRQQLAAAVARVDLQTLVATYRGLLLGEHRRQLAVEVPSANAPPAEPRSGDRLIEDSIAFKRARASFPP